MLFAGYAKQEHAEQDSDDTLAEEKTHTALAQLSVSGAGRKNESARVAGRLTHSLPLARSDELPVCVARIPAAPLCQTPSVPVAQAPLQRD
jgi:hypothetical protein